MRSLLAALLLAASSAPASRAEEPKPTGDLARIQGTWEAQLGPDAGRTIHLDVTGKTLRVWFKGADGQEHQAKGEIRLDESTRPRAMDWLKLTRDGREGPDNPAIYRLDGDTLQIRFPGPDQQRPADFVPDDRGGPTSRSRTAIFQRPKGDPNPRAR